MTQGEIRALTFALLMFLILAGTAIVRMAIATERIVKLAEDQAKHPPFGVPVDS